MVRPGRAEPPRQLPAELLGILRTAGDRIFLTCYTGYAIEARNPGKMEDLRRHVLCLDRGTGKIVWAKMLKPVENYVSNYVRLLDNLDNEKIVESWHAMDTWVNDPIPMPGGVFRQWARGGGRR